MALCDLGDSTVRCQGWRWRYGRVGDCTLSGTSPPVEPTGLGMVDAVRSSRDLSYARQGGEIRCWGYNGDNNLGDGGPGNRTDFGPVAGLG